MILISTLRKMGDKPVFIVNVPAHTVRVGDMPPVDIPAFKDAFATKAGADNFASTHDPRQWGATVFPVTSRMTARAYADELGWVFKGAVATADRMAAAIAA